MIMTKDKARELNPRQVQRGSANAEIVPADGMYSLTTTQDVDVIRKLASQSAADFFVTGMIIPAHKASAICQLLEDERGMMPSPVVILKQAGDAARTTTPANRLMDRETMTDTHSSSERSPMLGHQQPNIRIKDIEIIPGRHEVRVKGKSVNLTFSEFRILQVLASHPGWVFDRTKIIHAVHGNDYNCTERAVDVQVTGLRKKLGSAGAYIQTVRGVGYRFVE